MCIVPRRLISGNSAGVPSGFAAVKRAVGFEPTQCQDGSLVLSAWRRSLKNGPGSRSLTHDLAIIDRVLYQLSYPWTVKLVPGAGVEPA